MKLSVIVVNYNACPFLKQGLASLSKACKYIDHEVIVIDDASTDKSVSMVQDEYTEVHLIQNQQHSGVAKARNQGIQKASGEYVLLVNADTISGKKTLEHVIEFMDAHYDAGGVGVRMLSPRGKFLSESRTGFSRQWGAMLKLTRLAKYFPKSRLYKNDDNWIEDEEFATTEVDVINGAFMLLRKSLLNQIGGLDERLAAFGHDIDLSFRIRLAGYRNYYFPKTYILNYKIQPNTKFSCAYIKSYYGAMIIFAAKYLLHMPEIKIPSIPQIFVPKYEIER
ncbi:glycosyltransferase family 2 protein [Mucilaginibacter sp. RB4R14]|uniref:glycosyltransferase family 2 protein n=1 Tax=Mucilaginibacter aurantiaciroseus TaxID=2949308 RepID=UPI0020903051|nr:glycosyltransferase family 2 protein [Mucilaginibacter aurantiaciroseus]MCO5934877.1 glycosyltransferase family 2 protein [Mucilaginibacter aurantiaciroseus]